MDKDMIEKETSNIVFSYVETYNAHYDTGLNAFIDRDAMLYLSDVIGGFMLTPNAIYNGEYLEAKTVRINNIAQFKRRVCNKNTFIHTVEFLNSYPVYFIIDDVSRQKVLIEPYIRTVNLWKITYAVASK